MVNVTIYSSTTDPMGGENHEETTRKRMELAVKFG